MYYQIPIYYLIIFLLFLKHVLINLTHRTAEPNTLKPFLNFFILHSFYLNLSPFTSSFSSPLSLSLWFVVKLRQPLDFNQKVNSSCEQQGTKKQKHP
jgi:hypothetical protein